VPSQKFPADVTSINHALDPGLIAMSLPTSRRFITHLLNSLPSSASDTGGGVNPLSAVPETAKKQLLLLQVLFPNEFLPALDLLDRRLVTRLIIGDDAEGGAATIADDAGVAQVLNVQLSDETMAGEMESPSERTLVETPLDSRNDRPMTDAPHEGDTTSTNAQDSIYYVRSAQQRSSRYSNSYDATAFYEVRLCAWNCSCPAFAFAAFPAIHPEPAVPAFDPQHETSQSTIDKSDGATWIFGGVSLGDDTPPVCKHLLACVLVDKCSGLFREYLEERVVSVEEAAGWAAGWGD
jgi:hypothetical protein